MGDALQLTASLTCGSIVCIYVCSGRDVNSIVKSDTSTTSSNHIRVSDGSASSGNSTKAEVVATSKVATAGPPQKSAAEVKNQHSPLVETVSADYAEIEGEDKSERKQKGDTLQSAADSTLSTVSSFNSSMRDSTLLYDGGQDSFLDNLEPGAHNTPKFPIGPAKFNHAPVNMDYEKDPNYVQDHDYEQDPDYEKQKRFDPPLPPAHLYQALKQRPSKEHHYREPENTLRPLSEKLPSLLEQPDYADTIPHCNSLITPKTQNYTQLRASTLDPLPHYTHLDINTKEHIRGSGLSYVTTETDL